MKQDIVAKIRRDFENPDEIFERLGSLESGLGKPVSDRIYRSIVFLADGDRNKLSHYIDLALTDYRDLLWQAEYEDPEDRKYDFNRSFSEQGL
jgi:hypothetical protein